MPFAFDQGKAFETGDLFIGKDGTKDIGIRTERHAITFAGSGMGKGASVIIPNVLRWPGNVLCIDPKGENARITYARREEMGQRVCVVDPFRISGVPERLLASFNPLDALKKDSNRISEDISVLADGLMLRHDPKAGHWDGGATSILSGLIAHVAANAPPELRNLPSVRDLLVLPSDDFADVVKAMGESEGFGGLARTANVKITRSGSEGGHFLSAADENSKWLDSDPIREALGTSTFRLSELKTQPLDVFLVLPVDLIELHSRFLRVFVRTAINEMVKGGQGGRECLFLLDEFFSLGYMAELAKAPGVLRAYGVKLWPFLQDIGQLRTLYGREGAGTFFANSDVAMFFGNTDDETLSYISHRLGVFRAQELVEGPVMEEGLSIPDHVFKRAHTSPTQKHVTPLQASPKYAAAAGILNALADIGNRAEFEHEKGLQAAAQLEVERLRTAQSVKNAHDRAAYEHQLKEKGSPRFYPDEVEQLVGKADSDQVARSMIVFGKSGMVFNLSLAPYFVDAKPAPEKKEEVVEGPGPSDHFRQMRLALAGFDDEFWQKRWVVDVLQKGDEATIFLLKDGTKRIWFHEERREQWHQVYDLDQLRAFRRMWSKGRATKWLEGAIGGLLGRKDVLEDARDELAVSQDMLESIDYCIENWSRDPGRYQWCAYIDTEIQGSSGFSLISL